MKELINAAGEIDFHILKSANKEVYEAYKAGQDFPKVNPTSDIDYLLQLNKSFFHYFSHLINKLPESEQGIQRIKLNLALTSIEAAIKILSKENNILDKNFFLFYNVAYVSDIIKRNSSITEK